MPAPPTFDLYVLRFRYRAARADSITANLLRGGFGSALKRVSEADYQRYFTPRGVPGSPSGFADLPRPFVFRLPQPGLLQMNIFTTCEPARAVFQKALEQIAAFTLETCEEEPVELLLSPPVEAIARLRVRFVTPTELKPAGEPGFGILLSRIRDRVSALRALWGEGPLEIDFRAFGERAARVSMTRCELTHVDQFRTSKRTGQTHSLGGFVGTTEYSGDLAEFVPYLAAARYTGVGRQTVWGKGEIVYETF